MPYIIGTDSVIEKGETRYPVSLWLEQRAFGDYPKRVVREVLHLVRRSQGIESQKLLPLRVDVATLVQCTVVDQGSLSQLTS